MDLIMQFIDIVLHLDRYLGDVLRQYGTWTYLILFAILFCETGFVLTPFLPGDSLLFATGALAGAGHLDVMTTFCILTMGPILGDSTNYWIGRAVGPAVFERKNIRFLNKHHLNRAHIFYEKHGGKTVIIARFLPILRTFAPFVAGIAKMDYRRFLTFSLIGSPLWIGIFIFGGYFFGNLPVVKQNFSLVIGAIIVISVIPAAIEFVKARRAARSESV